MKKSLTIHHLVNYNSKTGITYWSKEEINQILSDQMSDHLKEFVQQPRTERPCYSETRWDEVENSPEYIAREERFIQSIIDEGKVHYGRKNLFKLFE